MTDTLLSRLKDVIHRLDQSQRGQDIVHHALPRLEQLLNDLLGQEQNLGLFQNVVTTPEFTCELLSSGSTLLVIH